MSIYQLEIDDFWDIWKTLITKNLFDIILAVWQFLYSEFLCFFIIVLQLGKFQLHISNTCSVKTLMGQLSLNIILKLA